MSLIKELYKEFNLDLIPQEENNKDINHNFPSSKKLNSNLKLQEQVQEEKDSIISDLDEDDEPLKYMSSILGKDENRAEMVWKMWSNYSDSDSDISFEVLKGLFECIHK